LASKPREEVFHFDFLLDGLLLDDNRHGCRSSVVTRDGNELKLEVRDQGKGMLSRGNSSQKKLGVDIEGMGERIKQFGGRFEILYDKKGTTVVSDRTSVEFFRSDT
jgi:signal transduction histidine kinase